ncbi:MAG: MFS transporter, partial [Candidatus Binatia bacterium]
MFYVTICAPADEVHKAPKRIATMSASWALGLIVGGPIGSAFSERVTWRWAFLLNLPCVGAILMLACICVPSGRVLPRTGLSLRQHLKQTAHPSILLNLALPVLLALALTFSGGVWRWNSAPALGLWLAFGVLSVVSVLYLWFTVKWRSAWLYPRAQLRMCALWVGSACAGSTYAISLYYLPLYFAFTRGADALEQTVLMLPFVLAFIVSVAVTGRLLRFPVVVRMIFLIGGAVVAAAGVALAVVLQRSPPTAHLVGLEILLGGGVGLLFQHSVGICDQLNRSESKITRLDAIFRCNLAQMGGIAVTLEVAGSIYQNVGSRLLAQAWGDTVQQDQIRELLAGSSAKLRDQATLKQAADI